MSNLADKLAAEYGHLITQDDLAQILHRSVGGLRWSLSKRPEDPINAFLKKIERSIGKRKFYPAEGVAKILDGTFLTPDAQ